MDYLKLKKAIFYPDKIIILSKKRKTVINISSINHIDYVKPSLLNYMFASVWFGGTFPGRLEIYLNNDLLTRQKCYTKLYLIRIKYKDYLKLPEIYKQKINLI
ncbi:MAG: hypothetical protein HDQ88_00430 [Clostridia bacterium]|nr:hypothetical protein [Clostridia bacterium]